MKPWYRKKFSPRAKREMNTNWTPHWLFWNSLTHLILTTVLCGIYSNPFFIIQGIGAQRGELLFQGGRPVETRLEELGSI